MINALFSTTQEGEMMPWSHKALVKKEAVPQPSREANRLDRWWALGYIIVSYKTMQI